MDDRERARALAEACVVVVEWLDPSNASAQRLRSQCVDKASERLAREFAAVRREALEAAAVVCDGLAHEADAAHDAHAAIWAEEVARRIRALASAATDAAPDPRRSVGD